MTNKEKILELLIQDDEAFTQIVEYFALSPEIEISCAEIKSLLEEMIEARLVCINYSWKTENEEYPYSLTEKGRKEWLNVLIRTKMDKVASFGEIFHLISTYELDRMVAKKFWTRKFKNSILKSLELLKSISQRIIQSDFTDEDIKCLNNCFLHPYISKNILPEIKTIDLAELMVSSDFCVNSVVNDAINQIINVVELTIINHKKQYKVKARRLLCSLIYLSRVYIDSNKETLFQLTNGLDSSDAIEYSISFLEENKIHV